MSVLLPCLVLGHACSSLESGLSCLFFRLSSFHAYKGFDSLGHGVGWGEDEGREDVSNVLKLAPGTWQTLSPCRQLCANPLDSCHFNFSIFLLLFPSQLQEVNKKLPFSKQPQTLASPPHPSVRINKFTIIYKDMRELHV